MTDQMKDGTGNHRHATAPRERHAAAGRRRQAPARQDNQHRRNVAIQRSREIDAHNLAAKGEQIEAENQQARANARVPVGQESIVGFSF